MWPFPVAAAPRLDCLHFQFAGLGHALGIYASPGTLAHLTAREAAGTEERAHRGDGRSHRHGALRGTRRVRSVATEERALVDQVLPPCL